MPDAAPPDLAPPPSSDAADPTAVPASAGLPTWAWVVFAIVVLAFPLVAYLRAPVAVDTSHLPDLGQVPAFSLVDTDARIMGTEQLAGSVLVVDFIFTRCPNMCPMLSTAMSELQDRLPSTIDEVPVRLVSISVDPDHDTPAVLAEYGTRYGVDKTRWHMLTGPSDRVQQTIADFKQVAEPVDKDGDGEPDDFTHGLRFLVLDADQTIRAIHEADADGLDAIERDVRTLAAAGGR